MQKSELFKPRLMKQNSGSLKSTLSEGFEERVITVQMLLILLSNDKEVSDPVFCS